MRAGYTNQVAEAKSRATLLERAEQNLAEARAARASAKAASLISRIDSPDAGIKPVGPDRIVIALCGVLGGVLAGFAVVFLTVPASTDAPTVVPAIGCRRPPVCRLPARPQRRARLPGYSNGHLSLKGALRKLAN